MFIHDNGKTVGDPSLHGSRGRFYFVEWDGQEMNWGRNKTVSIGDFRTNPHPRWSKTPMTDVETIDVLVNGWGLEIHEVTPECAAHVFGIHLQLVVVGASARDQAARY